MENTPQDATENAKVPTYFRKTDGKIHQNTQKI